MGDERKPAPPVTSDPSPVLIVGASARAAAASAVRAGLRPWCLDLFADLDLQQLAPVRPIPPGGYPHALADLLPQGPPGPWMYTGALENHPRLIERLARDRPLWGNTRLDVRNPEQLA